MSDITMYSQPQVEFIDKMGDDLRVVQAAQVSVKGANNAKTLPEKKIKGLINYLAKERHGSPFEHIVMSWYVKAPIFVFREFHRHRIASYNEMSGRYTELMPEFYLPAEDRPLMMAEGATSARPEFVPGTNKMTRMVQRLIPLSYRVAWKVYQTLLKIGVAKEVARIVLPVGLYSQMYVTMNVRALTNFLSLRIRSEKSRPQYEIEQVALELEKAFKEHFPLVYEAWDSNGRNPL